MHLRKSKKILIYFFLLVLVGSINNISFNNLKLKEINNIYVTGLGNPNNEILTQEIKNYFLRSKVLYSQPCGPQYFPT